MFKVKSNTEMFVFSDMTTQVSPNYSLRTAPLVVDKSTSLVGKKYSLAGLVDMTPSELADANKPIEVRDNSVVRLYSGEAEVIEGTTVLDEDAVTLQFTVGNVAIQMFVPAEVNRNVGVLPNGLSEGLVSDGVSYTVLYDSASNEFRAVAGSTDVPVMITAVDRLTYTGGLLVREVPAPELIKFTLYGPVSSHTFSGFRPSRPSDYNRAQIWLTSAAIVDVLITFTVDDVAVTSMTLLAGSESGEFPLEIPIHADFNEEVGCKLTIAGESGIDISIRLAG